MKYFTKELWLSGQKPGNVDVYKKWQQGFDEYHSQLDSLRSRVDQDAYKFFVEADVHDGKLLELSLSQTEQPKGTMQNYPCGVRLAVLDASEDSVWKLSYALVRKALIDFPSDTPLFYGEGEGFGDWGYHELTDAGDGFLRHEVLFATGAVLLFEFKDIHVSRLSGTR